MSDLDNAINSINASAAKAENTATFLDDMSTFDDQSSVTNPNNGQTVASIPKQVKDRTDELFTAAESDINQAVADAAQSATDAQDAADSIGRYQGLWPDSGGIADKGDTYQTQVSGTPTGQYFTALQNTTVDPVGDDVNWRAVVSFSSISGENLISNASFEVAGSVTNPPDATARDYNAGDELFQGVFAVGALTGVTYTSGELNGPGQLYTDVYKSEKQKLSTATYVASISGSNGLPIESGASFTDEGDYWRVTFDMTETFSVKFEQGNVATRHEAGLKYNQKIKVVDYGVIPNRPDASSSNSLIFESLIRKYMPLGYTFEMPVGDVYIDDIDVSSISAVGYTLSLEGVARPSMQGHIDFNGSSIIFNSDTTSTGNIGLNLGNGTNISIRSIRLSGLSDGRGASGDYIGIKCRGVGSTVQNSMIENLVNGISLNDLGYAYFNDNYYRYCKNAVTTTFDAWTFGTTLYSSNSLGVLCDTVWNVPLQFHSSWQNDIYEYCNQAIVGFALNCKLINVYFENNIDGGAVTTHADSVYVNGCFQQDADVADRIDVDFNPSTWGFDHGGVVGVTDNNCLNARRFKTVNTNGETSNYLSSSRFRSTGQQTMELFEADETLVGSVLGYNHLTSNTDGNKEFSLAVGGSSYISDVPSGWTVTKTGTGEWTVDFGESIRTPLVNVTITGTSTSTVYEYDHQVYMQGTNWPAFQNATGLIVKGKRDGVYNDNVFIFMSVTY